MNLKDNAVKVSRVLILYSISIFLYVIQAKGMLEVKRLAVELRVWFAIGLNLLREYVQRFQVPGLMSGELLSCYRTVETARRYLRDSEEVVTPLMLDGTYLSRNFATLGPLPDSRRVSLSRG